ncbi:MAG: hypothetical protein V3T21_00030 [Candidatus Margulisiibacteriota bacterium]
MNPSKDRFKIDNFIGILEQIERLGRPEYLPELEEVVIREIARLVGDGTEAAKVELQKLEKMVDEELEYPPRNKLLISALRNSIKGALSVAKICLF